LSRFGGVFLEDVTERTDVVVEWKRVEQAVPLRLLAWRMRAESKLMHAQGYAEG